MPVNSFLKTVVVAIAFIAAAGSAQAAKLSPIGVWIDHTGRGAIEIKPCGKRICGHVVWAKTNKDSKKGCRKQIIGNLRKVGKRTWDRGWIYSPERGQKYDLEVKPVSANKLRMLGYAGSKIFSKTMYWKRAPATLERCDQPTPATDTQIIAKAPATAPKTGKTAKSATTSKTSKSRKTAAVTPPIRKPATKTARVAKTTEPAIVAPKPKPARRIASVPKDAADEPTRKSPQEEVDAIQGGDLDNDDADNEDVTTKPKRSKKVRSARLKKKKRCRINAPFVTVTFPCKK